MSRTPRPAEYYPLQLPAQPWRQKSVWIENLFLLVFAFAKIPLLFFVRPRVVCADPDRTVVRIPFRRRTKNHLGSMYFGTLCTGVDAAGGFLTAKVIRSSGHRLSIIFKDVHGEFMKRAEKPVYFVCDQGAFIREQVKKAAETGERVNFPLTTLCLVKEGEQFEIVARFTTTMSIRQVK